MDNQLFKVYFKNTGMLLF